MCRLLVSRARDAVGRPRTCLEAGRSDRRPADVADAVAALGQLGLGAVDLGQHHLQPVVRRHLGDALHRDAGAVADALAERDATGVGAVWSAARSQQHLGPLGPQLGQGVSHMTAP